METKLDPTTKRWLIIGVGGIVVICLLFIIFKIFIFTPPKIEKETPSLKETATLSPEEVAIQFLLASQEGEKNEERNFLFPDLSKVEIFRESYLFAIAKSIWIPKGKVGNPPEFKILEKREIDDEAIVKIEEITNRRKGDLFFGFLLPEKIEFEITLKKLNEGWKVTKVDSENLIVESKIGEKVNLGDALTIKMVSFGEKLPENIKLTIPEIDQKFLFLKIEFENLSQKEIKLNSIYNWNVTGERKEVSTSMRGEDRGSSIPIVFNEEGKKIEGGLLIKPENKIILFLIFEVPQDFSLKSAIFQIPQKKIIFKI